MINVNMTDKAGVTLATAGKYCADNVKVTPSAEILRKDEQTKSATPTETAQDITPDSGKVLSKVSVGAIPKTYVGSGVTKKAAATVSPSTSEQTVCASGVYTTGEQKVSAITPSIVGNLDASSFAASIVAAIEGKGVTVPEATLLDGMAALIESIEVGGGMETIFDKEWEYGSITPAEDITANYTINFKNNYSHGLDNAIGYFFMFCDGKTTIPNLSWGWIAITRKSQNSAMGYGQYVNSRGDTGGASYLGIIGDLTIDHFEVNCTSSKMLCAGRTYNWIMIGV